MWHLWRQPSRGAFCTPMLSVANQYPTVSVPKDKLPMEIHEISNHLLIACWSKFLQLVLRYVHQPVTKRDQASAKHPCFCPESFSTWAVSMCRRKKHLHCQQCCPFVQLMGNMDCQIHFRQCHSARQALHGFTQWFQWHSSCHRTPVRRRSINFIGTSILQQQIIILHHSASFEFFHLDLLRTARRKPTLSLFKLWFVMVYGEKVKSPAKQTQWFIQWFNNGLSRKATGSVEKHFPLPSDHRHRSTPWPVRGRAACSSDSQLSGWRAFFVEKSWWNMSLSTNSQSKTVIFQNPGKKMDSVHYNTLQYIRITWFWDGLYLRVRFFSGPTAFSKSFRPRNTSPKFLSGKPYGEHQPK